MSTYKSVAHPSSGRTADTVGGGWQNDSVADVLREVERKFDLPAEVGLPRLDGLPGVASLDPAERFHLEATYLDSADLRLEAHRITLRRRTGGDDAGWHLKLPGDGYARTEVHAPLGRSVRLVPKVLLQQVGAILRGRRLAPVAVLANDRDVIRLRDAAGTLLAEVCDDHVTATAEGAGTLDGHPVVKHWREIEVELVAGDDDLLAAVADRLATVGAAPSSSASKLARALDRRPAPSAAAATPPDLPGGSTGREVVRYLAEQVTRLSQLDPQVRTDEPDAVHQMRVTCRRLRSALATFRPVLDREVTDPVRAELAWLGGVLGDARDAEVVRDHLTSLLDTQPRPLVIGPVRRRITSSCAARYRAAHRLAVAELEGERYHALLDTLDALVIAPPLIGPADQPADVVLPAMVHRAWRRTRRLAGAAEQLAPDQRDPALHEVRKAAKRARYAAESVSEVCGKPARKFAAAMARVQTVLGDHQDTVVMRSELLILMTAAASAGEPTFSYGRLHALEEWRAAESARQYAGVWAAAAGRELRTWMQTG
jgi:CHAD domain-containing protein